MRNLLHWVLAALAVLPAMLATGCATSRGVMALDVPQVRGGVAGTEVVLRQVTDRRVFEDRPRKPSIPSLGYGGRVERIPDEIKARAIARKRNSYGKAMGDILLPEGQTVEGVTRDLLKSAMAEAGLSVVDEASASPNAWIVDADIERFWAWFTPGAWVVSVDAWMGVNLRAVRGGVERPLAIEGQGQVKGMSASGKSWKVVYRRAFDDFLQNAGPAMSSLRDESR